MKITGNTFVGNSTLGIQFGHAVCEAAQKAADPPIVATQEVTRSSILSTLAVVEARARLSDCIWLVADPPIAAPTEDERVGDLPAAQREPIQDDMLTALRGR